MRFSEAPVLRWVIALKRQGLIEVDINASPSPEKWVRRPYTWSPFLTQSRGNSGVRAARFPHIFGWIQMAAARIAGGNRPHLGALQQTLFSHRGCSEPGQNGASICLRRMCVSFPNISLAVPFPLQVGKWGPNNTIPAQCNGGIFKV